MRDGTFHGENLRALRVAVCVDIEAFAAAVDYSWRHLRMIETGYRQPSSKLARRILAELSRLHGRDIHIDELSTPHAAAPAAATGTRCKAAA